MDYNNEMKRLEGHEPMKEIPESFESYKTVAATGRRCRSRDRAAMAGAHGGGFNTGSIIAGIGAVALAALVFFFSDAWYFRDGGKQTATNRMETSRPARSGVIEVVEISSGDLAQNVSGQESAVVTQAAVAADTTGQQSTPTTTGQENSGNAGVTTTASAADNLAYASTTPDVICLFPVDGAAIQENPQLNDLAEEAVADGSDVVVTGYADESGNAAYNQQLSARRAQAIGDYLVAHGVARDHISVEGKGETHAFESPALDRRVEVRLG
ncbi:MAG: OmpA family protein [Muribaculaceae bacterium]|nr:OmpA family protein [Muribaculaceae bacterium]